MIQVKSGTNTKSKSGGDVFFSMPPLFDSYNFWSCIGLLIGSGVVCQPTITWVEMVSDLGKQFDSYFWYKIGARFNLVLTCLLWIGCKQVRVLGSLFTNCKFWGRPVGYDRVGFDFRTW